MALTEWQKRIQFAHRQTRRDHRWVFGSDNSGITAARNWPQREFTFTL
jgi:hypothetical protein